MQTTIYSIFVILLLALRASSAQQHEKPGEKDGVVNLSTGVKLRYVQQGPRNGRPPIIFLHGFTDSSHSWSSTTPFLSEDYRIYALDQRGHGDSEKPLYGYSMSQYAEDVVAFMDKLRIEQTVIVGHSMGSFIAHQVASLYPQRVSHMVLIGSAPTAVRNEVFTFLWNEIFNLPNFTDPIDSDFIEEFQTGPNPVDSAFFAKVLVETAKVPARVWKAASYGFLTDDHSDFLDDVVAPTLIIWGDADTLFPEPDQQALQAALPNATFLTYAGAGHNTHWEEPHRVADDIRQFIQ